MTTATTEAPKLTTKKVIHCPHCTAALQSRGFTGYGTTIYTCPICKCEVEIKTNREPR